MTGIAEHLTDKTSRQHTDYLLATLQEASSKVDAELDIAQQLTSQDFVRGVKLYQQDVQHHSRALQVQSAFLS